MKSYASYVLRVRQPDGSWEFDLDNPMTRRQANKEAQTNRIIGGILCQIWPEEEALKIASEAKP